MRAHKALDLLKRTQFKNLDSLPVENEKVVRLLEHAVTFDPLLNRQRERKGRPLIHDAYEIKIRPHVVTYADTTGGTGRTHASPKMHYRRGHYRRLGDRLIPIPPCASSTRPRRPKS